MTWYLKPARNFSKHPTSLHTWFPVVKRNTACPTHCPFNSLDKARVIKEVCCFTPLYKSLLVSAHLTAIKISLTPVCGRRHACSINGCPSRRGPGLKPGRVFTHTTTAPLSHTHSMKRPQHSSTRCKTELEVCCKPSWKHSPDYKQVLPIFYKNPMKMVIYMTNIMAKLCLSVLFPFFLLMSSDWFIKTSKDFFTISVLSIEKSQC